MSTKKPNPYHIDFAKLTFGSWESDATDDKAKIEQDRQNLDHSGGFNARESMRLILAGKMACHEVRILFGQSKLRYDLSISHPRGSRGRIEVDFSQVSGVHFDLEKTLSNFQNGHKVTIQLSSPALTYIGRQGLDGFRKKNAVYETQQTDFSTDGAIKKARTHSFTIDNLNRLQTMKQRMEQHGFAAAIAAGLDESLLTASFTEEEVEASFGKSRGGDKAAGAPKNNASKKRPAPGGNENTGNNHKTDAEDDGGGESSAAAAARKPRAPPQPKKPNPKAVPGLLDSIPEDAGPWLQTCVQRWNLIAPFDPTIPDEMWESYYRERASLDWFTKEAKGLQVVWDEDMALGKKEAKPTPAWTEDFPKPPLYAYCGGECYVPMDTPQNHADAIGKALKKTIEGCPQLTDDVENIGDKFASSIYVLNGSTNWDDTYCRTFNGQIRLYSPYGLATSVDLNMRWHYRARMTYVEHFSTVNFAVRAAEDINHLAPQKSAADDKPIKLFFMDRADSGYLKRTLAPQNKLRAAEEALFGRKNLISERKMFNILMHAATSVDCTCVINDINKNIAPFSRRKWKKFVGETGCSSENDFDSENEGQRKNRKSKKEKLREMQEVFAGLPVGFPLGGYNSGDSDDEEEREECTIM
jgi:hypothetical protein